jgi:hypothetical protein
MKRRMLNAVFEGAPFRLGRLLQAFSGAVIKPAMVAAADSILFDPAKLKRSTAMRTMKLEQAELTAAIAKQDKLFVQQFHFGRPCFRAHNFRERDRPPVTSQHLAGRRAGPNAGHEFIFFFGQHLINPPEFLILVSSFDAQF